MATRNARSRRTNRSILAFEQLEPRTMLTVVTWNPAGSGSFDDPTSWLLPGGMFPPVDPPGPEDTAIFAEASGVEFEALESANYETGNVTFRSGDVGFTVPADWKWKILNALTISEQTGDDAAIVHSLGVIEAGELMVGKVANSVGTLTIEDDDVIIMEGTVLGDEGTGVLELVGEGAADPEFHTGRFEIARSENSTAEIKLQGERAEVTAVSLELGIRGSATVTVENDGRLTPSYAVVGVEETGEAVIVLRTGGYFGAHNGELFLGAKGQGQIVMHSDSQVFISGDAVFGNDTGAQGWLWIFDGRFEVASELTVGNEGLGLLDAATSSAALVISKSAIIAAKPSAEGSLATLAGVGTQWTNAGTLEIRKGGTLQVYNLALVTATKGINQLGGTIDGGELGVLQMNVTNYGDIIIGGPNFFADTFEIIGDLLTEAPGRIKVDIGGLTAVTNYDVLQITDTATLGGTLDVSLFNGFTPALGNRFDVITADTAIVGEFDHVKLPALPAGLSWRVLYGQNDDPQLDPEHEVTLLVVANTAAPVASNDAYTAHKNHTLTVFLPESILQNDSDADGSPLSAVLVSTTSYGALDLNDDGTFTYVPNTNFTGTDSFTYRASDGELTSNLATVTITVSAASPPALSIGDVTVNEAAGTATVTVTLSQSSTNRVLVDYVTADNTALEFDDYSPESGTLIFAPGQTYKTFQVSIDNDGLDESNETFYANLSAASNATISDAQGVVTISDDDETPVAVNDTTSVVHDRTLNAAAPGVLSNDYDSDSDPLTVELVSVATYGSVTLNANGSYVYTPPSAWTGVDTFTYRVWDGYQWSNTATVTVNVTNVQPSTSANSYVTPSSGPLVVAAPGVLGNDGDSDGDTLTASLVTNVSQGTLSFNSNGGFTYTKPSGFSGVVFFSYQAFDGVAYSNTTMVGITVSPSFLTLDGDEKEDEAGASSHVTKEQVRDLMHEAIARWHDAGADRQELRERWQDLNLHVFDLPDNRLAAQAGDDIVIDSNAAGHGWFVDETAAHDGEFPIFVADTERRSEEPGDDATGSVDLLAALMHEAGHWLGLPHYEPGNHPHNVMLDTLPLSTRRVPADGQGDVQPLRLKGHEQDTRTKHELRPTDLKPLIRIAAAYWDEQGVPREELRQLRQVQVLVTDLPGDHVGLTSVDTIWIDSALRRREAAATIVHEHGHVLGLTHDDPSGIMSASLPDAKRALFTAFADWDDWRL